MTDQRYERLERLAELAAQGFLTEEEFAIEKKKILEFDGSKDSKAKTEKDFERKGSYWLYGLSFVLGGGLLLYLLSILGTYGAISLDKEVSESILFFSVLAISLGCLSLIIEHKGRLAAISGIIMSCLVLIPVLAIYGEYALDDGISVTSANPHAMDNSPSPLSAKQKYFEGEIQSECVERFRLANNDLQRDQAVETCFDRRAELLESINPDCDSASCQFSFSGWKGRMENIRSMEYIDAYIITIESLEDSSVRYKNFPMENRISKGSEQFDQLRAIEVGDYVVFDGTFSPNYSHHLNYAGLSATEIFGTPRSAIFRPMFGIRLSHIEKMKMGGE